MRIVAPQTNGHRTGNHVTANRWRSLLRDAGFQVCLGSGDSYHRDNLLLALHARKSHAEIARFRAENPESPVVVVLTGTDLYHDLPRSALAGRSLDWADRIVVLQPLALRRLRRVWREKAVVVVQSALAPTLESRSSKTPSRKSFDVCVLASMRAVKDPLRTAFAAGRLPKESKIRVFHLGASLDAKIADSAVREMERNSRYTWLQERSQLQAMKLLKICKLMVLSSRLEGGANCIGEAVVCGVPVLASRVDGSVGLLGADYPGYFQVGDTVGLARLMRRCEIDGEFLSDLRRRCHALRPQFAPKREQRALVALIRSCRRR